jgi:hypothetical protein
MVEFVKRTKNYLGAPLRSCGLVATQWHPPPKATTRTDAPQTTWLRRLLNDVDVLSALG